MPGMAGTISRLVASLILAGLEDAAPAALDDTASLRAIREASGDGIPLAPYRRILAAALAIDGGRALLRAGEPLRSLRHPLLFVLLNSASPTVLIEKEARLAAFFHSRHRVTVEASSAGGMRLRHGSIVDPPEPSENLASCGQHVVLFQEIGCRDLRLRFPESAAPEAWVLEDGEIGTPARGGGYAVWDFRWSHFEPTRKPMDGLDELLLGTAETKRLVERPATVARVEQVLRRDLARTWRVSEPAEALGTSARSLQRALKACGERYSDVVERVRAEESARLLRTTELGVTEIGYVCGYADGAHFTRSLKKHFQVTPSAFRRLS